MGSDDEDHHLRKFGARHKIMISAIFSLFVVVLIILFLHFYLRYLQRRRRESRLIRLEHQISRADRQNHTAASAVAEAAPKAGLDPVLIARVLPESIHKLADYRGETVECSICLSNIEEKATVRILPNCKHIFHVECIDMWLFSNTTCPVCRTAVEPIVTATTEHGEIPTAPPLVEEQPSSRFSSFRRTMSRERSQAVHATAPPLTEEQSSSRLSSFRRMMSRDRERSFRVHSCGEASVRSADLERQWFQFFYTLQIFNCLTISLLHVQITFIKIITASVFVFLVISILCSNNWGFCLEFASFLCFHKSTYLNSLNYFLFKFLHFLLITL